MRQAINGAAIHSSRKGIAMPALAAVRSDGERRREHSVSTTLLAMRR